MNSAVQFELRDVAFRYGNKEAVRIEELRIPRGRTTCLLGPTGAGKTTLLRLLSGLVAPTTGAVRWSGSDVPVEQLEQRTRLSISAVFQHPVLLQRSVLANVAYPLHVRRLGKKAHREARAVLERFGLDALATRGAGALSGGQVQLVAIARALVSRPAVLLLDEPTNHLDPASVSAVEEIVREEQRARECTVVWATHNLFQAQRMSEQVSLLIDGRLVETQESPSFFETPADERTRDFLAGRFVC